jgi:hypothetical protein
MDNADNAVPEGIPALMEDVHDTVLRGDFAALPQLVARMEIAEATLHLAGREDLLRIRRLAERNTRTLTATRRGIKAAQRRVAEVLSAARGLVTYDRQGQRVEESDARELARRF